VTWKNDWPTILPAKHAVPHRLQGPGMQKNNINASRNFVWRDEFRGDKLRSEWNFQRGPGDSLYAFGLGSGISLYPSKTSMGELAQPSFIGRRQQHLNYSAETLIRFPEIEGVKAGLVAFQGEKFHYFFAVEKIAEGYIVSLEKASGSQAVEIKRLRLNVSRSKRIGLEIEARGDQISFYYQLSNQKTRKVFSENQDATILSTDKAGGFVGAYLGLHARTTQ